MARKKRVDIPDIDDIMAKLSDAEQYWGTLHAEQATDYDLYTGAVNITAPKGYNVVNPNTAHTIVSTAADHIAGDAPRVTVPEAGMSKKAQERSESLEHGLSDALWRSTASEVENPIRSIVIAGLWSGQMISQGPIFDGAEWGMVPIESDTKTYGGSETYTEAVDEYEDTKRTTWPFFWRALDPRNVFPDPGTVGREWVIVKYDRTAGSIKQQWPTWDMRLPGMTKSDPPLSSGTLVNFIEYWDRKYRAYIAGGLFLDGPREHRYAKPPFQIRSCGYGEDTGLPEERFRSILRPARALFYQQIAAMSQLDAMMRRTAWSVVLTPTGSGMDNIEPGTVKQMSAEDIAATKPFSEINPSVISGLQAWIALIEQYIQAATFPNVVQGIKAKGIDSGYGQNSLVAQAKVKYGSAVVNLSSLLGEFLVDFARCVQYVVAEPVPVFGQTRWGVVDSTLRPDEIADLKKVIVTVNPKLPSDRANEIEIGGVLLDRGAIDMDYYRQEFVGIENPGEMAIRVMRDRALQSPEVQRVLALAAALKGGYIDFVMEQAQEIGMDPGALLGILGFGNPSQQAPAANQGAGDPRNVAAQRQGSSPTLFSGAQKAQPGSPSAVRDAAVPGLSIG